MRLKAILFLLVINSSFAQESAQEYSLSDCISIALEENLNVRLSELDVQTSGIDLFQSRMDRLPNLNFNGGYGINWGRSIDPTTNDFIDQQIKFSSFAGNTSLTLFNGLQLTNSIKRDRLNYRSSQQDLERTKNDVALNVTTLYLDVIFNGELLQNANSQAEATRSQLEQTSKLVEAGSLPISNQLELEAQLASNEVEVVRTENNLNLSLLNLKQLLQIPAEEPFEIEVPQIDLDPETELISSSEEIYREALGLQPEVISADLRVESSLINMKVAKGGLYPILTLDGSLRTNFSDAANRERIIFGPSVPREVNIGFLASDPSQRVNAIQNSPSSIEIDPDFTFREQFDENLSRSLSLNLQIPVFNQWRTRNNMQRAVISNQQAEINAEQVRNQLRQNIETAHNNATAALKAYQASSRQVEALQRNFSDVENRYNLGVLNFVDYQVAGSNLFQARSDLARSKYDYIFRLKILDFYQGKPLSFE